jgi:quercetin dioxygenase-like cupin family protein
MHIIRASEGQSVERTEAAIFVGGRVWGRPVIAEGTSRDFSAQVVQFEPGARTRMHRHTSDQLLYIVAGIGKVGDREGEHVVAVGDTVLIPADTDHWHGAADTTSPMGHITVMRSDSQTTITDEGAEG